MKKLLFLPIMALSMIIISVSCSSDNDDDEEKSIFDSKDWEFADYKKCKYNDIMYIEVPAEGGTFTFHSKNGENISIDSLYMDNGIGNYYDILRYIYENNSISYNNQKACQASISGNDVNVVFYPNNEFHRNAYISVMSGGKKVELRFWQKPIGHSDDVSKKLEGEWVINLDESQTSEYFYSRQKRLCLNADGTGHLCIENYEYSPRFEDVRIAWKDSCGYIVYGWPYSFESHTFDIVDDNHFSVVDISYIPYGVYSQFLYERVEITNEPVKPFYLFGVNPYEDKTVIESKRIAKGNNYKIDKAYLVCTDIEVIKNGSGGYDLKKNNDTIDLKKYESADYEFFITRDALKPNHIFSCCLVFKISYTTKCFWQRSGGIIPSDMNKFEYKLISPEIYRREKE